MGVLLTDPCDPVYWQLVDWCDAAQRGEAGGFTFLEPLA